MEVCVAFKISIGFEIFVGFEAAFLLVEITFPVALFRFLSVGILV